MFSAFKKLTRSNDDRCPAPVPMSSSLQKKFSKGVHFNMKILIKGDRNVGKSCLLQRLQGGTFIENYVPTEQIQVAPIHWKYKDTGHIVKVEVWEVVDKGRTKKKPPLGLKIENQSSPALEEGYETPVLDATFLDVYKNASGVILVLDITKPWTYDYVVKELSRIPADLPVIILGNHCDMQHHRQVHSHHIELALNQAKFARTAPVRYAESSMRNGFGLRLLHKFLSVPFLRLQKTSLLEQLQRNSMDTEEIEKELDDFQNSSECQYSAFVERVASARREGSAPPAAAPGSPSIVIGAGKPIIPPNVNPLLAQSLNASGYKAPSVVSSNIQQSQPDVAEEALPGVTSNITNRLPQNKDVSSPPGVVSSTGALDEFYAGALDTSFLEDLTPLPATTQEYQYESDSDVETTNPRVNVEQDDLDVEYNSEEIQQRASVANTSNEQQNVREQFSQMLINDRMEQMDEIENLDSLDMLSRNHCMRLGAEKEFPVWAGDSSARRSPEGGEDPDVSNEPNKLEKKHKKKKSKESKERGDVSDKSQKEKKHKHKKSKSEKRNPQQDLLVPSAGTNFNLQDYDSL